MSELSDRTDLDQPRRQARELLRAVAGGDAGALREAEGLIAGQSADRPQLRLVLDAVLAALPALGPARSRVDLGLRLEHERPGGRLVAARDLAPPPRGSA